MFTKDINKDVTQSHLICPTSPHELPACGGIWWTDHGARAGPNMLTALNVGSLEFDLEFKSRTAIAALQRVCSSFPLLRE